MNLRLTFVTIFSLFFALALSAQVIVDPTLQLKLGTVGSATQPLRVVVTFDHAPTLVDQTIISGVASRFTMLTALPMALVETNAAGVQKLAATAGVKSLYADRQLKYFLHESVPLIQAPQAWASYGADGHGVGVAIIDSGIDGTHPDLPYPQHVVQNVKIVGVD